MIRPQVLLVSVALSLCAATGLAAPASASAAVSVTSLLPSTTSIDTTGGDATVSVLVGVRTGSGDPVSAVTVELNNSSGTFHPSGTSSFAETTSFTGADQLSYFDVGITVPAGQPSDHLSDSLHVDAVTVDHDGGSQTLVGTSLPASDPIAVTHVSDSAGPSLVSGAVAPSTVEVGGQSSSVAVALQLTDAASGVASVAFDVRNASGDVRGTGGASYRTALTGTPQSGVWTSDVSLPPESEPGLYSVTDVSLTDHYGNVTVVAKPSPAITFTVAAHPAAARPGLSTISIGTASVDATVAATTVPVTFTATAGPAATLTGGSLRLVSPTNALADVVTFGLPDQTSGDGHSATFTVAVPVPHYAAPGTWQIGDVHLEDSDGVTSDYTYPSLPISTTRLEDVSGTHTVSVTRTTDSSAPSVVSVSLAPQTFLASSSRPGTVLLQAHLTDTGSGIEGQPAAHLTSDGQQIDAQLSLASGTGLDGTWTALVPLPPGVWSVSGLSAVDGAGNTSSASAGVLSAAGTAHPGSGADTQAPVATSLDLVATTITGSATRPATGHLRVGFSDPGGSGLGSVSATFAAGAPYKTIGGYSFVVSGTSSASGVADLTFSAAPQTAPGAYRLVALDLTDAAGNDTTLGTTGIAALSSHTTVTVTDEADVVPPQVVGVSVIGSATVSNGAAPVGTGFRVHVTDDRGLTGVFAQLSSVNGATGYADDLPIREGATDQTSDFLVTLPPDAALGRYELTLVVRDETNTQDYDAADLAAAGFASSITVTGTADTSGPHLASGPGSIRILPAAPAVSGSDEVQVLVLAHVVSEGAPVQGVTISVQAPSPTPINASGETDSYGDGWYSTRAYLDAASVQGDRTISVEAIDVAGNALWLSSGDLAAAGQPSRFTVATARTGTAAQVTGITRSDASSGAIDTTSGPRRVSFDVALSRADGAPLGSPGVELALTGPGGHELSAFGYTSLPIATSTGVVTVSVPVGAYEPSGTYALSATVYDSDGFTSDSGAVGSVVVTALADTDKPSLVSLIPASTTVDVSEGQQGISLAVRASDSRSGVALGGTFTLTAPGTPTQSITADIESFGSYGYPLTSGTYDLDRQIAGEQEMYAFGVLPQGARAGTWTITAVHLEDRAGNALDLPGDGSLPSTAVTVVDGAPNDSPPHVVSGPSLEVSKVDASSTGQVVHVEAVTDDPSLAYRYAQATAGTVTVHRPGAADVLVPLHLSTYGTRLEGIVFVPRGTPDQTWTVDGLRVTDGFGRSTDAAGSATLQVQAAGPPPSSTPPVTAPVVVTPPATITPVVTPPTVLASWSGLSLSVPKGVRSGKAFTIAAVVKGLPTSRTIQLQRLVGKRWVKVATLRWSAKKKRWVATITLKGKGSLRLVVSADAKHTSTTGRTLTYSTRR